MVSSEAAPLAKTGGLADVVGDLPFALGAFGDEVAVVLPRYGFIDLAGTRPVYDPLPILLGPTRYNASIHLVEGAFPVYLVDCPRLFGRKELYGDAGGEYPDNHIRFAVLARAALVVARFLFRTEIFHCHDWQAGLVPAYLHTTFAGDPTFMGAKTLFTIHNVGYQGLFAPRALGDVALDPSVYRPEGMEFFSKVSYIKGGIAFADALSTVSPGYAREIQTPEYGFGLDGALRARSDVLSGILNGADYGEWNPQTDPLISAHYSAEDLCGKRTCKENLLAELGLPPEARDAPLIGVISRFAQQKGTDLIADTAAEIVAEGCYLVVLGSGEPEDEASFRSLAAAYPGRIAVRIGFDAHLSHRVQAGADMILMPSRYEPCGLTQLYALRYGTVPVVRATGGLDDTIDVGTGFKFGEFSGQALLAAIREAVLAFSNPEGWKAMMVRGMQKDFSWTRSAGAYSSLYQRLLGRS
jgi:starch synthase